MTQPRNSLRNSGTWCLMHSWYLDWPGPIVPYVRTTQRAKWVDPAYKRYQDFKTALRSFADTRGFPISLDNDKSYRILISIYLEGRSRYDLDNGVKGIMDALFVQDKRITEIWATFIERHKETQCTVTLEERRP